jgi:hypothetical protein
MALSATGTIYAVLGFLEKSETFGIITGIIIGITKARKHESTKKHARNHPTEIIDIMEWLFFLDIFVID